MLTLRLDAGICKSLQMLSMHQEQPKVGFLTLAAELRNMIYEMLLTTEYTFYRAPFNRRSESHYSLQIAILRVNKQIYHEASAVLHNHNLWITIRGHPLLVGKQSFEGEVERGYNSQNFIPAVSRTIPASIKKPALSIGLNFLPSFHPTEIQELLIGPESIAFLIHNLWDISFKFRKENLTSLLAKIHIRLWLQTSSMNRDRLRLQTRLLTPFLFVHGLGRVTFFGAANLEFDSHLCRQMQQTENSLNAVIVFAESIMNRGDELYAQSRYDDAFYTYDTVWAYLRHQKIWPWNVSRARADGDFWATCRNLSYRYCFVQVRTRIIFKDAAAAIEELDELVMKGIFKHLSKFLRALWLLLHALATISIGKIDLDDWKQYQKDTGNRSPWNPAQAAMVGAADDFHMLRCMEGGSVLVRGEFYFLKRILQEADMWVSSEWLDKKIDQCFKIA